MSALSPHNLGVVLAVGAALGLSLALFVTSMPVFRRPTLDDRIAPYLRDQPEGAKIHGTTQPVDSGIRGLVTSASAAAGAWAAKRLTTDASVSRRLERLGGRLSIEAFRARQIILIIAGLAAGAVVGAAAGFARGTGPLVVVALIVVGGVTGHLANDWLLSRAVRTREARILAEFPTVAELLALSMTAGEGTVDALERVRRSTSGELSDELALALAQARTGTPLVDALDSMAQRTGASSIVRFVDGIAVATSRGTPLAEVLRAQAADVREQGRRELMELSGRKEVGMLVPVVLFVLPITVVFAVYPSLAVLDIGG